MSDGIVPLNDAQVTAEEHKVAKEGYVERVLVAEDQELNVDLGGLPDETFSSRMARDAEKHEVVGEVVSKFLDVFEKDHGAKAQAGDLERADAVAATEEASGGV